MNTINQREYYKIFTGPEQNKGFENIFLGYEAKVSEQTLFKDNITTFHYPYFASAVRVDFSGLIEDGATAGAFPAVADRIYSQQKGYGEVTPWGNTIYPNSGELHYTWLFSQSGESPVWIDRYYNPGSISSENMLIGDNVSYVYNVCSENHFIDRISERLFEPGVMYQYHHIGESYAQNLLTTLSGSQDESRLRLHFNEWTPFSIDASGYRNRLQIKGDYRNVTINYAQPEEVDRNFLNFNTPNYIEYKILHSQDYNCDKEFSLACWIKADDWGSVVTSQIVGNAFNGGYQLCYNNFDFTPYFFLVGNTFTEQSSYSNLFCFNQNFKNYNTVDYYQDNKSHIKSFIIDGNKDLIVIDSLNRVQKLDHLGVSKRHSINLPVEAYSIVADKDNKYYVTTKTGITYIDTELLSATNTSIPCTSATKMMFNFSGELKTAENVDSAMYSSDNSLYYVRSKSLYKDNVKLIDNVSTFTIDPDGNLWIVHIIGSRNYISKAYVVDNILSVIEQAAVGSVGEGSLKQISILYKHSRLKVETTWYVVYVSNFEKVVYFITQDFFINSTINLLERTGSLEQFNSNNLNVCASDDFIGYEWLRINRVVKYNNTPQLTFKMSLRNVNTYSYRTFEVNVPYTLLKPYQWHHVCVTYKDNKITFYIDTQARNSLQVSYLYFADYSNCNSLFIGTYSGSIEALNSEIKIPDLTYNGCFDDLRIYNYAIAPSLLVLFNRSYFKAKDMIWNVPTSPIQYIEGIQRFFQHKIPGNKSQFYKIKIEGLDFKNVSDEQRDTIRSIVEEYIYSAVDEVQPVYTELFDIEWD